VSFKCLLNTIYWQHLIDPAYFFRLSSADTVDKTMYLLWRTKWAWFPIVLLAISSSNMGWSLFWCHRPAHFGSQNFCVNLPIIEHFGVLGHHILSWPVPLPISLPPGGYSCTAMISTLSLADINCDETLGMLRSVNGCDNVMGLSVWGGGGRAPCWYADSA